MNIPKTISFFVMGLSIAVFMYKTEKSVNELKSHTEILAHSVQNLDYEVSVLADLQRKMK